MPAPVITRERDLADGHKLTYAEWESGRRKYHLLDADGTALELSSVTTILDRIMPINGLIGWAEAKGAEGAARLAQQGLLDGCPPEQAIRSVRSHGVGREGASGIGRGLDLHKMLEDFAREGSVPNPADHPETHRGLIRALMRWLLTAKLAPLEIEQLVCHRDLLYAGRYDLRAYVRGRMSLVDLKTRETPRVYFKQLLQVAAYDLADQDCGAAPVEQCLVVSIGTDGEFIEQAAPAGLAQVWTQGLVWDHLVRPAEKAWDKAHA